MMVLALSLAGCSDEQPQTDSGANNTTDSSSSTAATVDTQRLWKSIAGVWEDGMGGYIYFSTSADGYLCDAGTLTPEMEMNGTLADIKSDGDDAYKMTVSFVRSKTQTGEPTVSKVVMSLTTDLSGSPRTISATDPIKGGTAVYTYAAPDMQQYLAMQPAGDEMNAATAFERFAGLWYTVDNGTLPFVYFSEADGEPLFRLGVLYSGELLGGTISGFEDDADNMVMTFDVEIPAVDSEEYSYEGSTAYITVVYEDAEELNKLYVSTNYGEQQREYRYIGANFDDISNVDPNTLINGWGS